MVARPKRPRGRPRGDLALVLRNQIWGRAVYERSGLSWDALDIRFLGEPPDGARPRTLWWIARIGIDPRSAHRKRATIDLVAAADEFKEFAGLKATFESLLWDLLTPPQRRLSDRVRLHGELLDRLGLYQATFPLRHAGAFALPDEPAFRPWDSDATRWITDQLEEPTLDLVALLGLSFQNALDNLELQEADCYLQALRRSLGIALKQLRCTSEVASKVYALVIRRLLRNDWTSVETDRLRTPRQSRSRTAGKKPETPNTECSFHNLDDAVFNYQMGLPAGAHWVRSSPIVPMNDRLRAFLDDKAGQIRAQNAQDASGRFPSLEPPS